MGGARHADPDLAAELERILRRRVGADGPGAVLGTYRDGALVASAAVGRASLEHDVPLTATTPIEVASVSKQITAATILMLAGEGLLDLDADVRATVPELRFPGITLRHCPQHTSGLVDYVTVGEILGVPVGRVCGYDAFLADLGRTTDLQFPPGTDVSYSNTGYVVAAVAAERVTGSSFPELVAGRVFGPLEMRDSRVRTYVGQVTAGMAFSYQPHPGRGFLRVEMGEVDPLGDARHTVGDGEVLTTIADFAAWHGFLLDGRVLGLEVRDQLLRRGQLRDGRPTGYGMGLMHESLGGLEAFGHSGSMWGYRAQSLTDPLSGTGVAVFGNRSDLDAGDIAWRALRAATDPVGVGGGWYSPEAVRGLEVLLRGDGGADVDIDDESVPFQRSGQTSWASASARERLELDGDTVVFTDRMGRQVRYRRTPEVAAPPPESVTGTYQAAGRPEARFVIRVGAHGLELLRGSFPPAVLDFVTTSDGADVYRVEGGWLTVDRSSQDAPSITISAGSGVLRSIPRTG